MTGRARRLHRLLRRRKPHRSTGGPQVETGWTSRRRRPPPRRPSPSVSGHHRLAHGRRSRQHLGPVSPNANSDAAPAEISQVAYHHAGPALAAAEMDDRRSPGGRTQPGAGQCRVGGLHPGRRGRTAAGAHRTSPGSDRPSAWPSSRKSASAIAVDPRGAWSSWSEGRSSEDRTLGGALEPRSLPHRLQAPTRSCE